jgi:hypothetical protein
VSLTIGGVACEEITGRDDADLDELGRPMRTFLCRPSDRCALVEALTGRGSGSPPEHPEKTGLFVAEVYWWPDTPNRVVGAAFECDRWRVTASYAPRGGAS